MGSYYFVQCFFWNNHDDEIYTHVGIKLKLTKRGEKVLVDFEKATGNWRQDFLKPGSFTTVANHYGTSYANRLFLAKEELQSLSLNELYENLDTIGLDNF